jgi:hypothetical protein
MARSRGIEKRLFEAVVLVLANGCWTAPAPTPPPAGPPPPRDEVTEDTWATPPPGDPPPDDVSHTQAPPPPPSPHQVCATHKRTPFAPSQIPPVPTSPAAGPPIAETSHWDAGQNAARCTIIREKRTTNVSVTITPRCCPSPGPVQRPCPGPQTHTAQGSLLLVEVAHVAIDGTVLASNANWRAVEPYRQQQPYCGRLPEGAHALGALQATGVGRQLAVMAELEAASVPAFERLARELAAHGAPASLVDRARTAMRDEIRHARTMRALAARHGVTPREVAVEDLACRSLEAIALENAVEGCVREAYGALVATYQAERAPADLRRVFRAIARDERRHAALAEDVHAWIVEQLDGDTRARIASARACAEDELRAQLAAMPRCAELGMPDASDSVALFDAYFAAA